MLEGNVVIDQEGRTVRADKVTIDKTQTFAHAQGRVQLAQGGLLSQSDEIDYNLRTQTGNLDNSFIFLNNNMPMVMLGRSREPLRM